MYDRIAMVSRKIRSALKCLYSIKFCIIDEIQYFSFNIYSKNMLLCIFQAKSINSIVGTEFTQIKF